MAIEQRSDSGKGGRIRLGIMGGGEGAFISAVHRVASRLDDHYDFVPSPRARQASHPIAPPDTSLIRRGRKTSARSIGRR